MTRMITIQDTDKDGDEEVVIGRSPLNKAKMALDVVSGSGSEN